VNNQTHTAFLGWKRIATGSLAEVLTRTKMTLDNENPAEMPLIFEDQTGKQVDFDLRGSIEAVLERAIPKPERTGPGRPRLGVTSREVSLLPRHWEWLETQKGGASATLRRLVDEGRKRDGGESEIRAAIEATGRIMSAIGGNLPGFEEAYRALYARDGDKLAQLMQDWPHDLREYLLTSLTS